MTRLDERKIRIQRPATERVWCVILNFSIVESRSCHHSSVIIRLAFAEFARGSFAKDCSLLSEFLKEVHGVSPSEGVITVFGTTQSVHLCTLGITSRHLGH